MKILAVDTATQSCSVAVSDNEIVLAEKTTQNGQTHSVHLLDMINTVTTDAGLSVHELEGFAVPTDAGMAFARAAQCSVVGAGASQDVKAF